MEARREPLFLSPRHLEVVCRTPDLLEDPEEAKDLKAPDKTAIQLEKSAERSRHTDDALPVCSPRECAVQEHTNWDFPLSPFWVHDRVCDVLTKWLSNEMSGWLIEIMAYCVTSWVAEFSECQGDWIPGWLIIKN